MPASPYVVGQWVRGERFYGRSSLIEEVLEGPRNWIWLLGTRRIGKTSLLKQIEHLATSTPGGTYFPIFWDLQGAENEEELHRGLSDALLDAEERLVDRGIDPEELRGRDFLDSIVRLRRRLHGLGLTPLLLCDEVEELIKLNRQDPALLAKLRRILQGDHIRSVLASTIRLWALAEQRTDTSPFLHGFTPPVYIGGLSDEEAASLVRQENLPARARPALDPATVREIVRHCDNHPYLIQLLCKAYLNLGDLNEAVQQVEAEQMVGHFFAVDFEMLSREERGVIRIIADQSSANSDSILNKGAIDSGAMSGILLRLEHLGYIRRDVDRRYTLANHFFRRWFLEQPASGPPAGSAAPGGTRHSPSQDPTRTETAAPEKFDGRYRLIQELGQGGTGVVYKAEDEVLREVIAIKVLRSEYTSNSDYMERLRREILLPRDIRHPNIPQVYYLGDCGGRWYLAMKFIDGPTLARTIAHEGPFSTARTSEIGAKIASALEAAHAKKVIHRDIKSHNILLDRRGEPYLTDFGLARLLTGPGMTGSGVFLGTPDYASPEQARGRPSEERSDLYSLGVVIFEMATGKRPFVANTTRQILEMHRNQPAPDPRRLRSAVPPGLAKLIMRCLEKNPDRRYQSAHNLRLALEACRAG